MNGTLLSIKSNKEQPSRHSTSKNAHGPSLASQWLMEQYNSLPCPLTGKKLAFEDYCDAFRFGFRSRLQSNAPYSEMEDMLKETWDDLIGPNDLDWEDARPAILHAYSCGVTYPKSQ